MDTPLRLAICEDLIEDRTHLCDILAQIKIPHEIVLFHSGEEFLAGYQMGRYDLIFMDIYMGGMTGIETVTELRKMDADVSVVFTTTSKEYALESYRLEAVNYLEKPVVPRNIQTILQMTHQKKQFMPKLTMRTKPQETQVALTDILYLEQTGSKYAAYLVNGEVLVATGKLTAVMEQLTDSSFCHCHKSFIVNFAYVKGIDKELMMFEMIQGDNVHIRRDGFWKTKRAYEAFLFGGAKWGATHD